MPGSDVREIKSRLDIVDLVGDYVSIRKKGQTYWGLCPFHGEKTPSFSVSQERQTFHCFGCGKGGDIFTFIMEMEHLEFREALEKLADMSGVKLKVFTGDKNSREKRAKNLDIQTEALEFFKQSLNGASGEEARAYLKRRSITPDLIKRFELGWAPRSWDSLQRKLTSTGYSTNEMVSGGLVSKGEKGYYDRFRGRVMFPIYNITNKLVGFGGRILSGDEAKYLNSPESPLFNKRNNLYLLNKAKMSVREKKSLILVEGYTDAIRAHEKGFTNTVASLGTALTEEQAILIKRMTGLCYICYDSDTSGQEAALRGMYILQKHGVIVKVVRLENGKDPDDVLIQENGETLFSNYLDSAVALPVYHAILRSDDINKPEKSAAAREDLLEGLASLSYFEIEPYLNEVAEILGIFRHNLETEILSRQENVRGKTNRPLPEDDFQYFDTQKEPVEQADQLECLFCSLLWENAEQRSAFSVETAAQLINHPVLQNIVFALLGGETPDALEKRWRQMGDYSALNLLARGNAIASKEGITSESINKIAFDLQKRCIESRSKFLQDKLKKGTASKEEIIEIQELTQILKGGTFGK